MKTTKTIEDITAEIADQADEAWERSNGRNWHRLVLTSEGKIYWAEEVGQSSMSEAVWKGEDCSLTHFQGQTWCGADEEAYEMIEASPEIATELDAEEEDRYGIPTASDGNEYRRGKEYYGYSPDKWYRLGDLLSFRDAHPDISEEEYMAQAIDAAEKFWASQEDE